MSKKDSDKNDRSSVCGPAWPSENAPQTIQGGNGTVIKMEQ